MRNETVVAVLWTLVAVTLVCFFSALVSAHADDGMWQRQIVPHQAPAFYGRR